MELDRDLGTIQSAVHSARAKWYNIGLQLQIPVDKLDSTKVDWHGDTGDCLRETLKAWLKRVNPPPDWKDIVNALKSGPVDECKLAEELNANYCSRSDVSRKLPLSEQKTQTPVGKYLGVKLAIPVDYKNSYFDHLLGVRPQIR